MRLFMVQRRVDDWPNAVAWYRDVLGLRILMLDETGRFALLDAGGTKLAIKGREPHNPALPSDAALIFEVDDLEAERVRLRNLGVLVGAIRENRAESFRECPFTDPEGNLISIFAWG